MLIWLVWYLHGHLCLLKLEQSQMYMWTHVYPYSKVQGANMGPTWVLSAPDGPHVGPMNLAIRVSILDRLKPIIRCTRILCVGYPSSFSEDDGWVHMSTTWRDHTLSCPLCYRRVVSSFEKNVICYLRGHQNGRARFLINTSRWEITLTMNAARHSVL